MTEVISAYLKEALLGLGVPAGEKLAIAVSGGADSTALMLLARDHFDITVLTVDHGLRPESAEEANKVVKLCSGYDIPHVTLRWQGEKPKANIQAAAREARYSLMAGWCLAEGVKYILTAHHQNDQAETLLLRLARGSGVYGLAAMAPERDLGGVKLLRPLLGVPKAALEQYLRRLSVRWIEDPSNRSEAFDRVKVRAFLENPPLEGLNTERLAATASRLRRSRDALEHYEALWLRKAIEPTPFGTVLLNPVLLQSEPEEITLRGLASVCRFVSGRGFVPRMEKLERLLGELLKPGFSGQTLYGCQVTRQKDGKILFVREIAAIEPETNALETFVWDNRFEITIKGAIAGLRIGPVGEKGWKQLKDADAFLEWSQVPRAAVLAMPALYKAGNLHSVPHLGYGDIKDFEAEVTLIRDIFDKK